MSALTPNGRFVDFRPFGSGGSRGPVGVPIVSYIDGLYVLGNTKGYYTAAGVDPRADLAGWRQLTAAGEPYTAAAKRALDEIYRYHGAYAIGGRPAPLLIEQGWTDDLFPSTEGVKVYNYVRGLKRRDFVSLQLGDLGHNRGSNKADTGTFDQRRGIAFLDRVLRGRRGGPRDGEVSAGLQTCPKLAPAGTPFVARSWAALHPGAVRLGARGGQTIDSAGGDPSVAEGVRPDHRHERHRRDRRVHHRGRRAGAGDGDRAGRGAAASRCSAGRRSAAGSARAAATARSPRACGTSRAAGGCS